MRIVKSRRVLLLLLAASVAAGLMSAPWPRSGMSTAKILQAGGDDAELKLRLVSDQFRHPWDIGLISARQALVTEKSGQLWRLNLDTGARQSISGTPAVADVGQGGMHMVVPDPGFASNGIVYLSYAVGVDDAYTTALMRARVDGNRLRDHKRLLLTQAVSTNTHHFGGAIVVNPQGRIFLTVGDRGERHQAQNLSTHHGKTLRINNDGSIPADNPFVGRQGALPEIYSYGHRNQQGLALDVARGDLWSVEHGPRGGDEINRLQAGRNYGWPVITYGKEYIGGRIGQGTHQDGMEQPLHYYVPSIATSALVFYNGAAFPAWRGSLLVGALRGRHLSRVILREGQFFAEKRHLESLGRRIRALRQGADGRLWIATDNGLILELKSAPASAAH